MESVFSARKALGASVLVVVLSPAVQADWSFQQGAGGYSGTLDTYLRESEPTGAHDGYHAFIAGIVGNRCHGLLWFQDIIGDGPNQIPPHINTADPNFSAALTLRVWDGGMCGAEFHRMLSDWSENDTWDGWGDGVAPHNNLGGIQADDYEAVAQSDYTWFGQIGTEWFVEFDVTASVAAWLNGDDNYGWAILPAESVESGWAFYTSEVDPIPLRPLLVVHPEPTTLSLVTLGGLLATRRRR